MKKTQQQVDATGMLALHRFAAIADSLLTPANSQWHGIEANDDLRDEGPADAALLSRN